MSEDQIKQFLEWIEADTNLRNELQNITDIDKIVNIAAEVGIVISKEDLASISIPENIEDELEDVAGGKRKMSIGCTQGLFLRGSCDVSCGGP